MLVQGRGCFTAAQGKLNQSKFFFGSHISRFLMIKHISQFKVLPKFLRDQIHDIGVELKKLKWMKYSMHVLQQLTRHANSISWKLAELIKCLTTLGVKIAMLIPFMLSCLLVLNFLCLIRITQDEWNMAALDDHAW